MQLVAPDILVDVCALSQPLLVTGLVIGLALWLLGWRFHRFWIVLTATVLAGIYGLYEAAIFRVQPMVAAVLLGLAAGMLALALVRLLAFLAGGLAGTLALQTFAPHFDQALATFVVSGLLGILLFRFSMMALSSLAGGVVAIYSALALIHQYGAMNAVTWAEEGGGLANGLCGFAAVIGLVLQFLLNRRRYRDERNYDANASDPWDFLLGRRAKSGWTRSYRKAG